MYFVKFPLVSSRDMKYNWQKLYTMTVEVSFHDLYVGYKPLFPNQVFLTEGGLCTFLFIVPFSKRNSELITLTKILSHVLRTLDYAPKYVTYAYWLRQRPMIFVDIKDLVKKTLL
jgi:hypothetical protein